MSQSRFAEALQGQIAYEFGASQQYIAIAIHYDSETLPRLAAHFYRQSLEERNHAMMMVQYLLDAGADVAIPGVAEPQTQFADVVAPVELALSQERRVTEQIGALATLAREQGDYAGEQFMQWFIKEQVEEVATMGGLLRVAERSGEDAAAIEEYLGRELPGGEGADPTAPQAAGAE